MDTVNYTFEYPQTVQQLGGNRTGHLKIAEPHLLQTHDELLMRIGKPNKTKKVEIEIDAPQDLVWEIAAGTTTRFFSHITAFTALTFLKERDSNEGEQFIIHRTINGTVFDRLGAVLKRIPTTQLTISDVDIADPSISGWFPSLYSVFLEPCGPQSKRTRAIFTHTMLDVPHPWASGTLNQLSQSIKQQAEEAYRSKQ